MNYENTRRQKRHLTKTRFRAALSALALIAAAPVALAQDVSAQRIEQPAAPLKEALLRVADAYGVNVIFTDDLVAGKTAPALSGELTAIEALEALLAGSDLSVSQAQSGALVIKARIAVKAKAAAAPPPRLVEDIIYVTAQKRKQDLQKVPLSLAVFESDEILLSNFDSLSDYAFRTANFSFSNNGNRSRSILAVRGVSDENVAATGTTVGFYLDEVSLNPTGGLRQNDLALLDLERIEVLRGPQGTLFGRNTIGGAINLVSRKPNETLSAQLTAGVERYSTYFVQGHVNVPIADGIYVLGSAMQRATDGFVTNSFLDQGFGNSQTGGRVALRLEPTNALTIDLAAMRNVTRFDGLQSITEPDFDARNYDAPIDFQPENKVESDLLTARIEYETPYFDIISLTAYNQFDRPEAFDGDGSPTPFATVSSFTTEESFSQELRLQSNGDDSRLIWTFGGFYGRTEDANSFEFVIGDPANPLQQIASSTEGTVENLAVFGELEFPILNKLTMTLGARYSRDDVSLTNTAGEVFEGPSDALTPKIGLLYQLNEDTLVYFTASRGYKPGGFDTSFIDDDLSDEITSSYDPETAWNYEIGVNASFFDNRLTSRATLFYLDWTDIQSTFFIGALGLNTLVTNAGAARSIGAELELTARPTDELMFNVNLGLLDAEYTDFDDTPQGDLTGNTLPLAPTVSLSLVGEYRRDVVADYEGFFRTEYNYRSTQEGRNNNNAIERQPAVGLLNLRTGVRADFWELVLYGENVLDKRFFTNRRPGAAPIPNTVTPAQPATWGLRATLRY